MIDRVKLAKPTSRFKKGQSNNPKGRAKDQENKARVPKDSITMVAEKIADDIHMRKLLGFLIYVALKEPKLFFGGLVKIMPLQAAEKSKQQEREA
jgi:hypothetical protein